MVADDRSGREATQRLNVDESLCELITLILLLPQRLSGQANNPVKIKYFRMFFYGQHGAVGSHHGDGIPP